jgi:PAS domain S-box-containing protein
MSESREDLERRLAQVEEELRIRTLHLDFATDGYFDWDMRNPAHEYMSPKFWTNLGYDPSMKKHDPSEWMNIIHPEDKEAAMAAFERHVKDGDAYRLTVRYRHARGHWEHVVCRGQVLRDEEGRPTRFVGTHHMITDLKRAESALEQFAFHAAHDMKEPLRKISAFGERLQKFRDVLPERGRLYLDRMLDASRRMSHLIDDLLEYARIGREGRDPVAVDLEDVLAEVVEDYSTKLKECGGRVSSEDLGVVEGDRTQLRQLFQNLLSNAIKFRRKDEPLMVTVRGEVKNGHVEVSFSDNGIGFEEEYREKIFQVFQRLHGRDEYEGTGIGLALCSRIVESHGGSIEARGSSGGGATFVFTLPRKKVEEDA